MTAPAIDPEDLRTQLPLPGGGATSARLEALWAFGERSPTTARILEAHHDALAILAEAGRAAEPELLHAVWAAGGPEPLRVEPDGGAWRLKGAKPWCSGASFAQQALVTAELGGATGNALVLVDLAADGVDLDPETWRSPAFPQLDTRTVRFDCAIDDAAIVGRDDWYLRRPGFWHGAVGVAACWAGAISGVVERLRPRWRDDAHALAALGAIDARLWAMRAVLGTAAAEIDRDPVSADEDRHRRALRVRHVVDDGCDDIARRLTRALGPAPLAHDDDVHRRLAEIDIYRRQSHAERDLEQLGRLVAGG